MKDNKNESFTFAFSLVQASYWMSACAVFSYAVVYLQALSFSNFSIGVITAAGRVFGSLAGPLIAAYLDSHPKFPTSGMNTPLLAAQIVLFFILQLTGGCNAVTGILFALTSGLFVSTNSVILRFCGDCAVNGLRLNYGIARGIGSLAYILPSVLLGILFKKIPASFLPTAGILLLAFQLAVNIYAGMYFKGRRSVSLSEAESGDSLICFIRKEPLFARLLAGIVLLFFGYYVYATFLINIVRNAGGDSASMGILSGVGAAIEIPFMFLLNRLRKKIPLSRILMFSVAAISLKILVSALVTDIPRLLISQILQGFGYALFAASIVEYVSSVIPEKNQAKGQSLIYTMEMVSGILANLIAGKLYDITTVKNTLITGFAVSAIGAAVCISGIKKIR